MTSAKLAFCAALLVAVGVGVVLLLLVPGTGASSGGDRFVQADDGTRVVIGGVRP